MSSAPRWASSSTAAATWSSSSPEKTFSARSWWSTRVLPTTVGLPASPHGPSPRSDAGTRRILSSATSARWPGGTLHGSHKRSATERRAGTSTRASSQPSSCSRVRVSVSPDSPISRTPLAKGKPESSAISGPTCPVSPSRELRPTRTRSKAPNSLTAAESARAVAKVSEPANTGSQRWTPLSAPHATASRRTSSAEGGPRVKTVHVPPLAFAHSTPLETARRQ